MCSVVLTRGCFDVQALTVRRSGTSPWSASRCVVRVRGRHLCAHNSCPTLCTQAVSNCVLVGASGEVSDFTYIQTLLEELTTGDYCAEDGHQMSPSDVYQYLTRVLYNRRNKFDPLWNSLVVAGVDARTGEAFLGCVGMIGTHYTDAHVATGFGAQLARPLFREKHREDMSAAEARELLEDALRVCYYRDKNSINKFQVATVTATGTTLSEPFALPTEWSLQAYMNPSSTTPGTW